jgi:hypothetical protein
LGCVFVFFLHCFNFRFEFSFHCAATNNIETCLCRGSLGLDFDSSDIIKLKTTERLDFTSTNVKNGFRNGERESFGCCVYCHNEESERNKNYQRNNRTMENKCKNCYEANTQRLKQQISSSRSFTTPPLTFFFGCWL